ncbi:MAG: hypothetical protein DMD81_27515 [Candidatus Rokuibacteriota bacterium]|nr:MAG: hypothetical protein DMD81_27515 [Candidatus Rokubacteria bacterium]
MTSISTIATHPGVVVGFQRTQAVFARIVEAARQGDPRLYQILPLASALTYGVFCLDFEVRWETAVAIVGSALATQFVCERICGRPRFDPRSALISALSLCLLLRTNVLGLAVGTAILAIASKFDVRVRGKHVFNPTNGAIVAMMLTTEAVWVLASAGALVVNRAARADVTWTFLACWGALLLGRSVWLGEPLLIPLHRLESGALVLFAFFMISDPKTTPDSRVGRFLFAALVALGAYAVQFSMFRTNALLWSLAVCSLAVPVIDRLLPGARYQWRTSP